LQLRFLLPLFLTTLAVAQQAPTADRQRIRQLEQQVAALQAQVHELLAARHRAPQATVSAQEHLESLGAHRQAILRQRTEFLKTVKPTHPDVLYLDKKLAAIEELLLSAELKTLRR